MTITNKIKIAIFDLANSMCNIQTTAFIRLNSVCQKPFLQMKPLTPILMTLVCVPRSYATCCLKMTQSKFFANNWFGNRNSEMDFSQTAVKWSNLHHFFLKRGLMGAGASSFTSFGLRSVSSSCMWKWTSHIFRKISSYQCHKVLLRFRREESLSDIGKWHTKKTERMQELRSSTCM